MNVVAIMATAGRHTLAERSLKFFIDQDYKGKHTLLIFQNSEVYQALHNPLNLPDNKQVILVNQHIDTTTGERYNTLGGIYNDVLAHIPEDTDLVVHWDDDDIFLNNHITEGVNGYKRATESSLRAYKPAKSWFRHPGGVELMSNTLEPSIFVDYQHLKENKYSLETTAQHLQWVNPLVYENKMLVDPNGEPTLIYNWGDTNIPTFKTSGDPNNPGNFNNYRNFSRNHGDLVLSPWSDAQVLEYYKITDVSK